MLVPPDNFGLVEPGVYRCLKLEADHIPFLATLQLKSIVLLDAAKPPRNLKAFLEENNIRLFKLGSLKFSNSVTYSKDERDSGESLKKKLEIEVILLDRASAGGPRNENSLWMLIEPGLIEGAFEVVFNRNCHNALIVDLSLTFVGILRRIQKWNFNSIVNEYRIYTGNASKNNYNAENFLELVEVELIPYEVGVWLRNKRDKSVETDSIANTLTPTSSRRRLKGSVSEAGNMTNEEDDIRADDYEDDMDDEILLASPQIPANLLKLVEQRKNDDQEPVSASPGTPPEQRMSSLLLERPGARLMDSRNNSFSGDNINLAAHRRRLSLEVRYHRPGNTKFRKPSFTDLTKSPGRRSSFETSIRHYRLEREKSGGLLDELARIKDLYDHHYYKSKTKVLTSFVEPIKLHLPPEHKLPDWFVRGRDFWEQQYRQLNP